MHRDERYEEAKYRVKISHFTEKGFDITGVVHVGTNDGYEFQWYRKMGIEYFIGFEPLPIAIEAFAKNYPTLATGKEFFFGVGLGLDDRFAEIYQTTGDGQGSSFLQPTREYSENHPEYFYINKELVDIRRFDTFMTNLGSTVPMKNFDCLVCDVQGMELYALMGMGIYLQHFSYLNIECSEKPVYQNSQSASEIISFLKKQGFKQDSPIEEHNDIMFIREDLV